MKKFLLSVSLFNLLVFVAQAQNFLSNVPSNASVVIKYSGDNFSKNVPVKKLDAYNFVKNNLFKALRVDSLNSLENTGIDFEKDAYQYLVNADSSMNLVTLFSLENVAEFLQLVQANYHAEMRPEKKNGFEYLSLSKDSYLGWNGQQAILVYCSYTRPASYWHYPGDTLKTATVDSAVVVEDFPSAEDIPNDGTIIAPPAPPKKSLQKKPVKGKKKPAVVKPYKKGGKKPATKKKPVEAPVEEEPSVSWDAPVVSYEDSVANANREAWYKEQDQYMAAKQNLIADSIINNLFNGKNTSLETAELSYKKLIDPAAHVSVWMNYDNLMSQYWSYFMKAFGGGTRLFGTPPAIANKENKGFRYGVNLFFEKDKMRAEQKMYSPDEQMAALGREIYNSKQSNALAGFINPDNIAFLSSSINTEAMANYYYKLMRQYLSTTPFVSEYSDLVDVYMDLLEIIIDEKAVAELMPGNMIMVLHDMKTKTVSYTDYVYDEQDFSTKEVKKTKQELSPNFTFAMETKKETFMRKLANLPVKYAKKEKFNYTDKGGYYELAFEPEKYPLNSLYFMVKAGKLVITTSKEVIDMALIDKGYTLAGDTKNNILDNNMYLKINSKKLIQQIKPELTSDVSKEVSNYLEENIGDLEMKGGLKDGMMQGTSTMAITGTHANSFEFIFNMIDSINDIIEKAKAEKEKKID